MSYRYMVSAGSRCPDCGGTGYVADGVCDTCGESGYIGQEVVTVADGLLYLPSTGARINSDHIVGIVPCPIDTDEGRIDGYLITTSRQIFGLSSRFSGLEVSDPKDVAAVTAWLEARS